MSLYHLYVYKHEVLIPTVCQTETGVYLDEAPVTSIAADSKESLEAALVNLLSSENPKIFTAETGVQAGSAILDLLTIKKWSDFEKQAIMYTIHSDNRRISIYITGRGPDGMWKQEFQRESSFEISTAKPAIVGFLIQEIEKDILDEEQRPRVLLLPPPPAS